MKWKTTALIVQYTTYSIADPCTGDIVYVGQTANFEQRKKSHLRLKKRPNIKTMNIKTWLHDLISDGKVPVIAILETVETEEESLVSETKWVEKFAKEGHPLLNRWNMHRNLIKHYA